MSKVFCGQCDNLRQRKFCSVKEGISVSRKKAIECDLYAPKVAFVPAPPTYIPAFDKKTRRIISKLIKSGVLGDGDKVDVKMTGEGAGQVLQQKTVEVPRTSATAGVLGVYDGQAAPAVNTSFDPYQENEPTQG